MPIFEYQCQQCGHVFEVLTRRVGRVDTPACPECGRSEVERLLSAFTGRMGSGAGCASTASGIG